MNASHVTTHILDTSSGRPAANVQVELLVQRDNGWSSIAGGTTDSDGRIRDLGPRQLDTGVYRLSFATGAYFARHNTPTFFPEVALTFEIADADQHYHVPLLLSPFAYSTYRGS
ncbi:hydroxyisourate hydrolase [Salinisphaera sp.]|uniref:hydroxyisourate hydrolase n=1 Tax=Salinisphaera sp. TaxID=1914330 RepID=UPI002D786BDD|nr:hydroxyisourate hydrolase [Salinisphaera sp.]HET7315653.1 hydroxyisourate hydrolase [Salinisphaera sp.]